MKEIRDKFNNMNVLFHMTSKIYSSGNKHAGLTKNTGNVMGLWDKIDNTPIAESLKHPLIYTRFSQMKVVN